MSLFRRLAVFLLLALWLPATQHCGLEAAGLWDAHAEEATSSACCSENEHCSHDGCEIVESSSIPLSNSPVKVPMPALQGGTWLLYVQLVAPTLLFAEPAVEPGQRTDRPLGWVYTWHFERRAARSPRAPSSLLA